MDDAVEKESLKKPRRGDFKGQRSETDSNRITNPTGIQWSYTRRVTFSAETAGEDAEYTHKKLSLRSPSLPFISISWTLDLYIPMTTQNLSLLPPTKVISSDAHLSNNCKEQLHVYFPTGTRGMGRADI